MIFRFIFLWPFSFPLIRTLEKNRRKKRGKDSSCDSYQDTRNLLQQRMQPESCQPMLSRDKKTKTPIYPLYIPFEISRKFRYVEHKELGISKLIIFFMLYLQHENRMLVSNVLVSFYACVICFQYQKQHLSAKNVSFLTMQIMPFMYLQLSS